MTPINAKALFAIYHVLREYCETHPSTLRGTQVRVDVNNQSVVQAFNKDRSRNTHIHQLLVALFHLQVEEGLWLRLRWVPVQDNADADSMKRFGIEECFRLRPKIFIRIWNRFGLF